MDESRKLTPEEQAQKEFDEAEDNAMIEEDLKWAFYWASRRWGVGSTNWDDGIETEEDL